jgi:DNA processing protein
MLFFTDPDFPRRLKLITDFPPLLFFQGVADLNAERVITIVGTRRPTDYGRQVTERLVRELDQPGLLIVSGLAFGIDAAAHNAALANQIPTIGVLGHGLAHCYPREHAGLFRAMRQNGGLLSPFPYASGPTIYNFATRNHVVAGLCDALIVVETGETGGSLITVKAALDYKKKIFAVPGRLTDQKSAGCHGLIQRQDARLLVSGDQLMAAMGWQWPVGGAGIQSSILFPPAGSHSSGPEQQLLELLREKESLSIDELAGAGQLDPPAVAMTLLSLELQGLIRPLPGKRYRLSTR